MACSGNGIKIVPVNVKWQIEAEESIDFAGLTGATAKGNHIVIYSAKDATKYALWGDDGVEADPVVSGATLLPFTIVGDSDTAITLAAAAATALNAHADFVASATGTVVTSRRAAVGQVTGTADGDMGVVVNQCFFGQDLDLGLLQGDVAHALEPSNYEIKTHQTGVTTLGLLGQGVATNEILLTLQETDDSKLEVLYGLYGGAFTPSAGTKVFGVGTAKQGVNLLPYGARLILKPVTSTAETENMTLPLALPVPDTMTFSGENPRTLAVTFRGFPDLNADSRVNTLVFGDHTQDGVLR